MAFLETANGLLSLYDKRSVTFKNIAGQIILPGPTYENAFARAPYMIRFQSGWLNFDICSVHIYLRQGSQEFARIQKTN